MSTFDNPTTILNRNATQSISTSTWTRIIWDNEERDDQGAADLTTQPTRITIPASVVQVRFLVYTAWDNNSSVKYLTVEKNSGGVEAGGTVIGMINMEGANEGGPEITTKWLQVTPGDYFDFWVFQTSGGTRTLQGSANFGGPSYVQAEFVLDDSRLAVIDHTVPDFSQTFTMGVIDQAVLAQTIEDFAQSLTTGVVARMAGATAVPDFTQTLTGLAPALAALDQIVPDFTQDLTVSFKAFAVLSQTINDFTVRVTLTPNFLHRSNSPVIPVRQRVGTLVAEARPRRVT